MTAPDPFPADAANDPFRLLGKDPDDRAVWNPMAGESPDPDPVEQPLDRPRWSAAGAAAVGVATLALATLTVWAFAPAGSPTAGATGVRADPADVYNPVLAGEPLPDGFRQVLPRDGIAPVYDPVFVSGADAGWPDDAQVIGVTIGDESKAYPVSFLNGREMVVDEIDGVPILVTW